MGLPVKAHVNGKWTSIAGPFVPAEVFQTLHTASKKYGPRSVILSNLFRSSDDD